MGEGGFILECSDENCYCFNPEVIQTLRDSPGRAAPAWLYNFFITSNWIALIITVALFHLSCERAQGHHLWKTSIQPRVWVGQGGERWQLNRLSRGKWFTSHGIHGVICISTPHLDFDGQHWASEFIFSSLYFLPSMFFTLFDSLCPEVMVHSTINGWKLILPFEKLILIFPFLYTRWWPLWILDGKNPLEIVMVYRFI